MPLKQQRHFLKQHWHALKQHRHAKFLNKNTSCLVASLSLKHPKDDFLNRNVFLLATIWYFKFNVMYAVFQTTIYSGPVGLPLTWFSLTRIPLPRFLAYVRASGGFSHQQGTPTVQISCTTVFSKSQNARTAGTLCILV